MTHYEIITNIIIERLEAGSIPWRNPWRGTGLRPSNFISKKPYKGFNALITASMGYKSPYFVTFNQAKKLGGSVKGQKGVGISIPISKDYIGKDGKAKTSLFFKKGTVFNLEQVEGVECPVIHKIEEEIEEADEFIDMEHCEQYINGLKGKIAEIVHEDTVRAYYRPSSDFIGIALKQNFKTEDDYYSTLFHEIVHSTGHENRLKRDLTGTKGSATYAKEELIAEIGASFLCGDLGILNRTVDNHANYIASWLQRLKDNPDMITLASSKAERVMEYLNK